MMIQQITMHLLRNGTRHCHSIKQERKYKSIAIEGIIEGRIEIKRTVAAPQSAYNTNKIPLIKKKNTNKILVRICA